MSSERVSIRPLLQPGRALALLAADTPQTALAMHQAGVKAAAVGGFSINAIRGEPDHGQLSLDEYLEILKPLFSAAPSTAFLIDAEQGFDDPARTVQEFLKIPNASLLFIEDQIIGDKRCGHMDRHAIVSEDEMCCRLRDAVGAKNRDGEPFIMARTDARSACGSIEAAIDRARAYRKAGADVLFIEAPRSREELEQIAASFPDVPLLANIIEGGKTPELSVKELGQMGFQLVVRPVSITMMYTKLVQEMVREFYSTGELHQCYERFGQPSLDKFQEFIGLSRK